MSTSSTTAATGFNGQSSFSADLQNVITRSVAIAQLPITQLQNNQSSLTSQQSELQTLGNDFQNVQTALDSINAATGAGSYTAAVDDNTVASASLGSGALPGTYAVNIVSIGSQTNTISPSGSQTVSDPSTGNISSSSTFTLSVGGSNYSLTPAGTSLNSLVAAINASGAKVQATVVNVGGTASPDYRLSVQSTDYAPDSVGLSDGTNSLLSTLTTGSNVTYQVNGQPANSVISSSSRDLSISTGLTLDAIKTGSVNVTVAAGTSSLSTALNGLAAAYNTAVDELTKNRGQNGGALSGQSIVSELSSALQTLTNYSNPSGSVNSIADLGLTFDDNGHLNFDQATLSSAAANSLSDVSSFLGTETGSGFLSTAYSTLTSLTDSTSGAITLESQSVGTSITNLTSQIAAKQDQLTQLQANLSQRLAQADAAISSLEQQVTEITNLFSAETQASKNITG